MQDFRFIGASPGQDNARVRHSLASEDVLVRKLFIDMGIEGVLRTKVESFTGCSFLSCA
jgi:hypothetical protein